MKQLLFTILTLLCLNSVFAQSHNPGPNSNCKLSKGSPNIEKIMCPACENIKQKEREAKAAEDKRRFDVLLAKEKVDKAARDKAWHDKVAEDKKIAEASKVYINGNTAIITNKVTESKKEPESIKQNYFHALSLNYQDNGNPYWLDDYFTIFASKGFIVNTDTLFRDNQFKKCIGIRYPSQLYGGRTYNDLNFPPNIGIVILNEQKTIPYINKTGTHLNKYAISDLIDIQGNRILKDDNITAILHFVDDYFILFKGAVVGSRTDRWFEDAVIYNYKTKETYPVAKDDNINKIRTGGYVRPGNEADSYMKAGECKARFYVTCFHFEMMYYINNNGKVESKKI